MTLSDASDTILAVKSRYIGYRPRIDLHEGGETTDDRQRTRQLADLSHHCSNLEDDWDNSVYLFECHNYLRDLREWHVYSIRHSG